MAHSVRIQRAEVVLNAADSSCNLEWELLAAWGKLASDHGREEESVAGTKHVRAGLILGRRLTVHVGGTRVVAQDTDEGRLDHDARADRPVGPMQLTPAAWQVVGVDADNDGKRDPQDIDDSALAAAVVLCSGADDLAAPQGQRRALLRLAGTRGVVEDSDQDRRDISKRPARPLAVTYNGARDCPAIHSSPCTPHRPAPEFRRRKERRRSGRAAVVPCRGSPAAAHIARPRARRRPVVPRRQASPPQVPLLSLQSLPSSDLSSSDPSSSDPSSSDPSSSGPSSSALSPSDTVP